MMTTANLILPLLEKVRSTGQGRYVACCPAHNDTHPSLAVRELSDGRLLLHCFAGCPVDMVCAAIGIDLADLFPPRDSNYSDEHRHGRASIPASDAMRCLSVEGTLVAVVASDIAHGKRIDERTRQRLLVAVGRINSARGVCHV
jgi:hypothetical protein